MNGDRAQRFVVGLAFLVAFGAAPVWLAAEVLAGFREQREPSRSRASSRR